MTEPKRSEYVLGYQDNELQRLMYQSRFLGELTEDIFRKAGIGPGMRVLDVGCGVGDVSLLAATLVGPSGSVLGVDRSAEALAIARKRAISASLTNVSFAQSELDVLSLDLKFDALVGRLVLLYMKDPAACLRQWANHVLPGGIVVFHEMVMTAVRSFPPSPTNDDAVKRVVEVFRRAGNEVDMGMRLYQTFVTGGLPAPQMMLGGRVEGGPDALTYAYIAESVRSLMPMMEEFGVWTAREAEIDTLAIRIRDEVVAAGGVVIPPPMIGAWVRLPQ